MSEETQEKSEEKQASENAGTGDKSEEIGLIDRANSSAERLEVALKKQEELIRRQEEIIAKRMLAGRADAGNVETPKEETAKEYKDRVMRGLI